MPIWVKNLGMLLSVTGFTLLVFLIVFVGGYFLIGYLLVEHPTFAIMVFVLVFFGPLIYKAVKSFFTEDWSKGWKGSKYKPED